MKKETFDSIIKDNAAEIAGNDAFGYTVSETLKTYANYYSNQSFLKFVEEMKSSRYNKIFMAYSDGKGNELAEHIGRYGKLPPKMASVASSSRFCFLALKDGADALGGTGSVKFEHECRIANISGIAPQLDAYVENENIFIEAKCHEIFDPHRIVMKNKYWDLIYGNNQFGLDQSKNNYEAEFEILLPLFGLDKAHSMFDIKQFLCHLLGITSQSRNSKRLVYMFFMPESDHAEIQKEIDSVFSDLKDEIYRIFKSEPIRYFCRLNDIKLWAIAEKSKVMEPLTKDNMMIIYKDE